MAAPLFSSLVKYIGKPLTDTDWNTNFQTIVNWLTGTPSKMDVSFGAVAATTVTATTVTATTLVGNGTAITGLAGIPIGGVQLYAGALNYTTESTLIPGFLYCDGRSLLKAGTYANLYSAIGTAFGIPDVADTTHFCIPDMRGYFARGLVMTDKTIVNAVDTTDDIITVTSGHQINRTGMAIRFTTTTALPTGLAVSTTYYARVLSPTTFSVYDTYAHAVATGATTGRVDLTAPGTGTNKVLQWTDADADTRDTGGLGSNTGKLQGSKQNDAFQGHWHNIGDSTTGAAQDFALSTGTGATANGLFINSAGSCAVNPRADLTNGTPRTSEESRPKNLYFNYIIRYL